VNDLWAVMHDPERGTARPGLTRRRIMAKLGEYSDWNEAQAAWQLADNRIKAGLALEVDYLVIRDSADPEWAKRYPQVRPGRLTALLAFPGRFVRVRIYGNDYTGTVVKATLKAADVRFWTGGGERIRSFPILPHDSWARGVQA
jgi:hypothetical protein